MLSPRLTKLIATGAAAVAIGGGTYGIVSAIASNGPSTTTMTTQPASRKARSGPAAGGAVGTVARVTSSSFTLSTAGGQNVTVARASTTTALKKGETVLVLGTVDGTTITASRVTTQSVISATTKVVPFQRGAPSTAKQVGQIPVSYTEGSGTIVSGTAANKATSAALASYPGGIVDRVVRLSNGEYEVHDIGVNWPHHIFVTKQFKAVGAD